MIKDKGKPVFEENVDDVLAKKIITHTRRNSKTASPAEAVRSPQKTCCASLRQPVWKYIFASAAALASLVALILLIRNFIYKKVE